jgi:hypothetical protein
MSRRVQRVPVYPDPQGIKSLPMEDIRAILRGADDLIGSGGRTLLAKILKGSQAQDVLAHELDESPVHGYFHQLTVEEILARIDWVLLRGYLRIEYSGRLPLLSYTDLGWSIEKETDADELLRGFDELLAAGGPPFDMTYLKDRNRDLIWLLLDKVEATKDARYIPLLEAWAQVDYRKVRERIHHVIGRIRGAGTVASAE